MTVAPPLRCDNQQTTQLLPYVPSHARREQNRPPLRTSATVVEPGSNQISYHPPFLDFFAIGEAGEKFLLSFSPLATALGRKAFWNPKPKGALSEDATQSRTPAGCEGSPGGGHEGLARVQDLLLAKNTASSDHFSWSKTAVLVSWGNKNKCWFL